MKNKLTQSFVQNVTSKKGLLRVRDTLLTGLILYVNYGGKKTYFVDYTRLNGKRASHKIGDANVYTAAEAREMAREFLATVANGKEPIAPEDILTFERFLEDIYGPWVTDNRKSGRGTYEMLKKNFNFLADTRLDKISIIQIEQWRTRRKKNDGLKSASLNRVVGALQTSLNWAVKRGMLEVNPLSKLERLSERDSVNKVRYLTDDERDRLMKALDEREKEIRRGRESHNKWFKERGLQPLPSLANKEFADHLKPVVILSLNTGIRRNSMLSLEWRDVDFVHKTITVRALTSKSDKQYFVPMNDLVFDTLTKWKAQSAKISPHNLVFPSPQTNQKMHDCNSAWESVLKKAEIGNFRWHDMRHDFASQLVMNGIDLNTVRELMGHADLKMTLRYAHLAPEVKMQAVQVLNKRSTATIDVSAR